MRKSIVVLFAMCVAGAAAAQEVKRNLEPTGAWLDVERPQNWNTPGAAVWPAPKRDIDDFANCKTALQNATPEQRRVAAAGWKVTGQKRTSFYTLVFAMTSVDGMCRPMGFQVFVFSQQRYVGTLSPVLMDSRVDGMIASDELGTSRDHLTADFYRYKKDDALCCPSGLRRVSYKIVPTPMGSVLTPIRVRIEPMK